MEAKQYQQRALDFLGRWWATVKETQAKLKQALEQGADPAMVKTDFARMAWEKLRTQGRDLGATYMARQTCAGEDLPHVCLKIPTGGGKTFVGVKALEKLERDKGLVLWVVPTKAIYEQTMAAFKNRDHVCRKTLEILSAGKVKVLSKEDRFTRLDVDNRLCLMLLMFPAANRKENREFLKISRDAAGYETFFPPEDDIEANKRFLEQHKGLELAGDGVKQSLENTIRIARPLVILDEAHKAYGKATCDSKGYAETISNLNPRAVIELSATPEDCISNVLVDVSGAELKDEEMVKLPIEVHSTAKDSWKQVMQRAEDKLKELEGLADDLDQSKGRHIRPIALVRVERTGKAQREKGFLHAEDVREHLLKNAVPARNIKVQSSEAKELAGENLLSRESEVSWIITKDALKEGWDCSFAYILVVLDKTKAKTAVTQMVGRVMRQPEARLAEGFAGLNRCYIYCHSSAVEEVVQSVKQGLEKEGLADLARHASVIHDSRSGPGPAKKTKRKTKFASNDVFIPQVMHADKGGWRPLDYDRDVLGALAWDELKMPPDCADIHLHEREEERKVVVGLDFVEDGNDTSDLPAEKPELSYFVFRLLDLIPNPWQAARIVEEYMGMLGRKGKSEEAVAANRGRLSYMMQNSLEREIHLAAEKVFLRKVQENEIRLNLVAGDEAFARMERVEIAVAEDEAVLTRGGDVVQRSLFEPVYMADFNKLEKDFAFYLEKEESIRWWHRVAVKQECSVQGWQRQKIYPDFLALTKQDRRGVKHLLVIETKGRHLQGNEDTDYKQKLLNALERASEKGEMTIVSQPKAGAPKVAAKLRMLFSEDWEDAADRLFRDLKRT